jgi:hypothetical protein
LNSGPGGHAQAAEMASFSARLILFSTRPTQGTQKLATSRALAAAGAAFVIG